MTALILSNLSKIYQNGTHALQEINLTVAEGDFFALLGPNGAGKSTAIGIMCSLINKTSGQVQVFGYDLDKQPEQVKSCIGIVPQEFNFNIFESVMQILLNQAGYYGIAREQAKVKVEHYLRTLGLWEKRLEPAMRLSGGMKRRLMIARALIHEPKLLILDEPTAGVDIELRRSLWEFIKKIHQQGTTIILTTHYLEEAENLCKNIAIINQGKIIANTSINELLKRLDTELFILYLKKPLIQTPCLAGFKLNLLDETTLEVEWQKGRNLADLFLALAGQGIEVISLRNKTNRLEELFLRLIQNKETLV